MSILAFTSDEHNHLSVDKTSTITLTEAKSLCNLASHTDRTLSGSVQLGIPWNALAASPSP